MIITVTSGKGFGKTPLSAFDSALKNAGVHNFNLLVLSSIVPPKTEVQIKKFKAKKEDYGNRLYVVKAEKRTSETGKCIGAALGWYQIEDGRGVFVEHEEIGETEEAVEANLAAEVKKSLSDLCRNRKYPIIEKRMKFKMSIVRVKNTAACALVIAVYKSEPW